MQSFLILLQTLQDHENLTLDFYSKVVISQSVGVCLCCGDCITLFCGEEKHRK